MWKDIFNFIGIAMVVTGFSLGFLASYQSVRIKDLREENAMLLVHLKDLNKACGSLIEHVRKESEVGK